MKLEQIGVISVDSGTCWIGDPCYILQGNRPKSVGKDWDDTCDIINASIDKDRYFVFNHDKGHEGLGLMVLTGCGDGVYPVFIERNEDGRVKRVVIEFE